MATASSVGLVTTTSALGTALYEAVQHELPLHGPAPRDDLRVAFEVPHFLADFLGRHLQVALVPPELEAVVQDRQHQQGDADLQRGPQQGLGDVGGDLGHVLSRQAEDRRQFVVQAQAGDRRDHRDLEQPEHQPHQVRQGEDPPQPRERIEPAQVHRHPVRQEEEPALHQVDHDPGAGRPCRGSAAGNGPARESTPSNMGHGERPVRRQATRAPPSCCLP